MRKAIEYDLEQERLFDYSKMVVNAPDWNLSILDRDIFL